MSIHKGVSYAVLRSESGRTGWDVIKMIVEIDRPPGSFGEIKSLDTQTLATFRYKSLADRYRQRCEVGLQGPHLSAPTP